MRVARDKLGDICSWLLVACAVITTALVARREFLDTAEATSQGEPAMFVDRWQEVLRIGLRSGPESAPIQIVEFADFQCPACARLEPVLRALRKKYPTQVAVTLVHFPLPHHGFAEPAARVAECAHLQGVLEPMQALLFAQQQAFGPGLWVDLARKAGVRDLTGFEACVNDTQPVVRIEQGKKAADQIGVRGTPTIIVNGWKLRFLPTSEDLDKIVKNVLSRKEPMSGIGLT